MRILPLVGRQAADDEENRGNANVGAEDVHPHKVGEGREKGEERGHLLRRFLKENADAGVHERMRKVNCALSLRGDSQVGDSQVGLSANQLAHHSVPGAVLVRPPVGVVLHQAKLVLEVQYLRQLGDQVDGVALVTVVADPLEGRVLVHGIRLVDYRRDYERLILQRRVGVVVVPAVVDVQAALRVGAFLPAANLFKKSVKKGTRFCITGKGH